MKKEVFIEIKKSKFIAYYFDIKNVDDVINELNILKEKHKKSKHIVYAYKIGPLEKKYEDKEPSGTSGSQLLNVIHLKNIDNVLIVVVRYFGGTLLGVGPLAKAYRTVTLKLFS